MIRILVSLCVIASAFAVVCPPAQLRILRLDGSVEERENEKRTTNCPTTQCLQELRDVNGKLRVVPCSTLTTTASTISRTTTTTTTASTTTSTTTTPTTTTSSTTTTPTT